MVKQKGLVPILIAILLALIGIVGAYYFRTKKENIVPTSTPNLTINWSTISPIKGYSFKCPPGWECHKIDNKGNDYNSVSSSVVITEPNSSTGSILFSLQLITPQLFQKSMIKNPNYSSPIKWYEDLKMKNGKSINVPVSTIFHVPGTDGIVYPVYHSFDFNKMKVFQTDGGVKGLIFSPSSESVPDTYIIIPLSNNLLLIYFSPSSLIDEPIVKGILTSIKSN